MTILWKWETSMIVAQMNALLPLGQEPYLKSTPPSGDEGSEVMLRKDSTVYSQLSWVEIHLSCLSHEYCVSFTVYVCRHWET